MAAIGGYPGHYRYPSEEPPSTAIDNAPLVERLRKGGLVEWEAANAIEALERQLAEAKREIYGGPPIAGVPEPGFVQRLKDANEREEVQHRRAVAAEARADRLAATVAGLRSALETVAEQHKALSFTEASNHDKVLGRLLACRETADAALAQDQSAAEQEVGS